MRAMNNYIENFRQQVGEFFADQAAGHRFIVILRFGDAVIRFVGGVYNRFVEGERRAVLFVGNGVRHFLFQRPYVQKVLYLLEVLGRILMYTYGVANLCMGFNQYMAVCTSIFKGSFSNSEGLFVDTAILFLVATPFFFNTTMLER